jgi:PAS domain S-box-containing protein
MMKATLPLLSEDRRTPTPGSSRWPRLPAIANYAIAVVMVAAAVVAARLFAHVLDTNPIVSLFLCGIMFVGWLGGTGPAWLAAVLSVLAFDYFFVSPVGSVSLAIKDIPRVVLFAVAAILVVLLTAAQRSAADSLRRTSEGLLAALRKLEQANKALLAESAERKRVEQEVRRAEQDLQATIDTIPVLVATYRPDGSRDFVNQTWQSYTGISLKDVQDKDWSITVHPDDMQSGDKRWRACMENGRPFAMEMRFLRMDGEYRWHAVNRVPLRDANGEIVRWYSVSHDIEDQKRAEAALRESEAHLAKAESELRLTLDWIPTLAWHARADGFAEYLNKRWLDYTGLSLQEALGWEWRKVIHPDDLPKLLETWRRILDSGDRVEVEARMRRHDGEYRWFLFRPEPLRDKAGQIVRWYGTNTDIEDRKRAENALRRSEAYLAEAQRLSLTGTFGWKLSPEELYWSDQTYRIFAYDRSSKPTIALVLQRVHPDDISHVQNHMQRASRQGGDLDFEHRLLMPDGSVKHLRVLTRSTVDASNAREIVGAVMDITQAKRAQEALQEAQVELAHITRVTTLGQLSASIAHEVSQPLVGIVTNGDASLRWLEREIPDVDEAARAVKRIISDAERASNVIRRIRDLAKNAAPEMAQLNINEVIEDAIALVRHQAFSHRTALRLELASGLPEVLGDRIQLQQVIINLVMNGVEAMAAVSDRPRDVVIRSQTGEPSHVLVAVRDAGVGLNRNSADRLFSPFYTTKPGSMGMGLSICRSIVEAHGGRVWATSNTGSGATIQFTVPQYHRPH